MKKNICLFLSILLLSAVSWTSIRGKIEGTVIDDSGNPIPDVSVEIVSMKMATRKFKTKSDNNGKFTQIGLWPDYYQVSLKKNGFLPVTIEVRVRIDESSQRQITMHTAEALIQKQLSAADKKFVKGNKLYAEGKYPEAIQEFLEATRMGESQWAYFFNLGLAYKKSVQDQESIAAFSKAAELNPDSFSCNKEAGEALGKLKNFTLAKKYYAKAIDLNAEDADTNYNYGVVLVAERESEPALAAFLKAVELKEDYAEAYYQIGTIYIGQNKKEEALAALEKFLELAPEHPQAQIATQLLDYLKKKPL